MQFRTLRIAPEQRYDIAHINLSTERIQLYWKAPSGRVLGSLRALHRHLEQRHERLLIATNAGIFEPGQIPTGLYVERGRVRVPLNTHPGTGNFYLQPNGVFFLDAHGA